MPEIATVQWNHNNYTNMVKKPFLITHLTKLTCHLLSKFSTSDPVLSKVVAVKLIKTLQTYSLTRKVDNHLGYKVVWAVLICMICLLVWKKVTKLLWAITRNQQRIQTAQTKLHYQLISKANAAHLQSIQIWMSQ